MDFYENLLIYKTLAHSIKAFKIIKINQKANETGLTEKATSSLFTVHNELQKKERDKNIIDKLNNIIIGINQRVFTIIEEETNRFNLLLKYYSDVIGDYKNKSPLYISNIKVIGGNKNNEFIKDLLNGYTKMQQFVTIMRNFTVIK